MQSDYRCDVQSDSEHGAGTTTDVAVGDSSNSLHWMGYSLPGASLLQGRGSFIFIRRITIGTEWWRLGRFLQFSYRLKVLGVVLPYHYD